MRISQYSEAQSIQLLKEGVANVSFPFVQTLRPLVEGGLPLELLLTIKLKATF